MRNANPVSSPLARTTLFNEVDGFYIYRTVAVQIPADVETSKVRFLKAIRTAKPGRRFTGRLKNTPFTGLPVTLRLLWWRQSMTYQRPKH
jgi:hypothetical protein